jgi:hypothetical protein
MQTAVAQCAHFAVDAFEQDVFTEQCQGTRFAFAEVGAEQRRIPLRLLAGRLRRQSNHLD